MRVAAAPVQLVLPSVDVGDAGERWWGLPEITRMQVLSMLARLNRAQRAGRAGRR